MMALDLCTLSLKRPLARRGLVFRCSFDDAGDVAHDSSPGGMALEITNSVPVSVVGGGVSGCMAAIAAARLGAKTLIVERYGFLGGTLTNLGFELYGDKAVLRSYGSMFQLSGHAGEPVRMRLELDDLGKVEEVPPAGIQNIYQTLIEHHAESVQNGTPINAEDAVHNLKLCAAAHESAQNGGKVIDIL